MGYWYGDMGEGRDVLWRIVALLFSLAALADRAAGLHGRRQCKLLMVLSWGEAEGRSLITGLPVDALAVADAPPPAGASCRADEAAVLAARFRVLALALWFALAGMRQHVRRRCYIEAEPRRHARFDLHGECLKLDSS